MITECVIAIGKPGHLGGLPADCTAKFRGKSLLEHAMEEARAAGARRYLIAFEKGHAARNALTEAREFALRAGEELVVCEAAGPDWDEATLAALAQCYSPMVWLADPTMLLLDGGQPLPGLAERLLTAPRRRDRSLLAAASLSWEAALHHPLLQPAERARVALRIDRQDDAPDGLALTFAGRALVNRAALAASAAAEMPDLKEMGAARFPGEYLVGTLCACMPGASACHLGSGLTLAAPDVLRLVAPGIFSPPRWLEQMQSADHEDVA